MKQRAINLVFLAQVRSDDKQTTDSTKRLRCFHQKNILLYETIYNSPGEHFLREENEHQNREKVTNTKVEQI